MHIEGNHDILSAFAFTLNVCILKRLWNICFF